MLISRFFFGKVNKRNVVKAYGVAFRDGSEIGSCWWDYIVVI